MIFAIASHIVTLVNTVLLPPRRFAVAIGTAQVCSVDSGLRLSEGSDIENHSFAIMKTSVSGTRGLLGLQHFRWAVILKTKKQI